MEEEGLLDEEVQCAFPSRFWTSNVVEEDLKQLAPFHSLSSTSKDDLFLLLILQKVMRRSQHARKETEFLRLKRTRLGLDDFESLKVIGRGAFGEVR